MSSSKKILVIDDDPSIVDVLQIMLEMHGYEVVSTVNIHSFDSLCEQHPHLMLLDIWMPGKDGRDLCKEVKSKAETRHIPVVMISASRDVKKSALEAGADDFIAKPFDMDELLHVVDKYVQV